VRNVLRLSVRNPLTNRHPPGVEVAAPLQRGGDRLPSDAVDHGGEGTTLLARGNRELVHADPFLGVNGVTELLAELLAEGSPAVELA
jgi:hypothetical protein